MSGCASRSAPRLRLRPVSTPREGLTPLARLMRASRLSSLPHASPPLPAKSAAAAVGDKARELNEKHKISERAGEAATQVKESAQAGLNQLNAKLESSGAKEALKGFWSSTTSAAAGLAEKVCLWGVSADSILLTFHCRQRRR